ncbi:MAG: acetaldehyde dehydrogenase (acetylating) [Actinomycetota bacterium]
MKTAIIGSGNIGTDLMKKAEHAAGAVEVVAMCGIDPDSDGLAMARAAGLATTADGIEGLTALPEFADVELVFDATSAGAHLHHDRVLQANGKRVLDLTPAAVGPYVIPPVNLEEHLDAPNLNMVTCGGQATVPVVAAVGRVAPVEYGEIVSSVSSRSAGPGTRANIDEFTETTAKAIEVVGGAQLGKAIIVLNPAEPPLIMRNTVFCLTQTGEPEDFRTSIAEMVERVQAYVPGYRLKQEIQIDRIDESAPVRIPQLDRKFTGWKISVFLEVEGAGHYLPPYAGNLDIMTSAALRTAEEIASDGRRPSSTSSPRANVVGQDAPYGTRR